MKLAFWVSVLLLAWTYAGYPALLFVWARFRPREARRGPMMVPAVSVIVVARNEARRIRERLENLLALDYPGDRMEILVASDGSTDGTAERARSREGAGVRICELETPRGKPAALNRLAKEARGEILVFADARQRFETGALRALVAPFADPAVGAVSGELILTRDWASTAVGDGVGFYWRYEKFIRRHESRVDSSVGATGAIYAVRRDLFEAIPEDTILDDVMVPMRVVRQGFRVLFEPAARAYDREASTASEEFRRKVRTIAGNFQLLAREAWLLNPLRNRLWLQTVSHKGLRLLGPLLLLALLAASAALAGAAPYGWALAGQAAFYAAALAGRALRHARRRWTPLMVPYVFCLLNWATAVAFLRCLTGRQSVTWEKATA